MLAWDLLDHKQRKRLTKLAEQTAGTAKKLHQSTLPAVEPGQIKLIPAANAAAMLGIAVDTLREWKEKGWIKGAEKIGGRTHYPIEAVELAASQHPRGPKAQKEST